METTLKISDSAKSEILTMKHHVEKVRMFLGESSEEFKQMSQSLLNVLAGMMDLGGEISRDGHFSLFGVTDYGMVYGVVFHRDHNQPESFAPGLDIPEIGSWSINS